MAGALAEKILFIGWDAADWKVIHPLLDPGRMPNLEKIVNRGVIGNLVFSMLLPPAAAIALWRRRQKGKS
ncbi:MAG: hypothetical protein AB1640_15830 [bacterium]